MYKFILACTVDRSCRIFVLLLMYEFDNCLINISLFSDTDKFSTYVQPSINKYLLHTTTTIFAAMPKSCWARGCPSNTGLPRFPEHKVTVWCRLIDGISDQPGPESRLCEVCIQYSTTGTTINCAHDLHMDPGPCVNHV